VAPPRRTAVASPPPPRPPVYYDYEEPLTRRPLWPWLLAVLFAIGAGIGGWLLYNQISDQLSSSKPVAVGYYVGLRRPDAVAKIHDAGLRVKTIGESSVRVPLGFVISQEPDAGSRLNKGSQVTLRVSTGKPKVEVPAVVGESSTDAVARLTDAGLRVKAVDINSPKEAGTVIAQDPPGGTTRVTGSTVRINISKGPAPVAVPSVVGQSADSANSTLQAAGFNVRRVDQDSNQPKNTVIRQDPAAGASTGKGSTVTIFVSKGTSQDVQTAGQTLHASGFNVRVTYQPVDDPSQDNIVLSQDPSGSTQARPGTVIQLTAGRFSGSTETTDTTTTP
jgi:serine/threonine-protein kinase